MNSGRATFVQGHGIRAMDQLYPHCSASVKHSTLADANSPRPQTLWSRQSLPPSYSAGAGLCQQPSAAISASAALGPQLPRL